MVINAHSSFASCAHLYLRVHATLSEPQDEIQHAHSTLVLPASLDSAGETRSRLKSSASALLEDSASRRRAIGARIDGSWARATTNAARHSIAVASKLSNQQARRLLAGFRPHDFQGPDSSDEDDGGGDNLDSDSNVWDTWHTEQRLQAIVTVLKRDGQHAKALAEHCRAITIARHAASRMRGVNLVRENIRLAQSDFFSPNEAAKRRDEAASALDTRIYEAKAIRQYVEEVLREQRLALVSDPQAVARRQKAGRHKELLTLVAFAARHGTLARALVEGREARRIARVQRRSTCTHVPSHP